MEFNAFERNLLKMPLSALEVSLETPVFAALKQQIFAELHERGLKFRPYFWISDEWFCPDGYAGVAVPFFLLDPELKKLERKMMGFVDGRDDREVLKILRHETGHAFENAFRLKQHLLRIKTFGSHTEPYPHSYRPRPYSRGYVHYLGKGYAQSHPDEDFAETFAVWLDPDSHWRARYAGLPALKKLKAMDFLMASFRGKNSNRCRRGRYSDISTLHMSLGDYYRRKQRYFRLQEKKSFIQQWGNSELQNYLRTHRFELVKAVSSSLGQPQYLVQQYMREVLKSESKAKHFSNSAKSFSAVQAFHLLVKGSRIYLEKGLDRVIL